MSLTGPGRMWKKSKRTYQLCGRTELGERVGVAGNERLAEPKSRLPAMKWMPDDGQHGMRLHVREPRLGLLWVSWYVPVRLGHKRIMRAVLKACRAAALVQPGVG